MPLTETEELELLELEAEEARAKQIQQKDPSILATAANVANELNYGLTSSVPGLQGLAEMAGIGVDRTEGEYPTAGQGALRMTGMGVGFLTQILYAPLRAMGVALETQAVTSANAAREGVQAGFVPSVKTFLQNTAKTLTESPGKFIGIETAASASAGAAGASVYEMTHGNETAKAAAELVGGTAVGAVGPAAKFLYNVTPTGQIVQRLRAATTKGGERIGKARAAARINRATDDPYNALRRAESADVLEDAPLTVIEKSEDSGLLALEASVRNETDQLSRANRERFAEINRVIREAFNDVEPGDGDTGEARKYLADLMDERIRIAGVKVEERLAQLDTPGMELTSRLARMELDEAYQAAVRQENQLWARVDNDIPAALTSTMERYQRALAEIAKDRVSQSRSKITIPGSVREHLGSLNKKGEFKPGKIVENTTAREVKELRSDILLESQIERAKDAPNRRKLRLLADLQEGLLHDLQAVQGDEALDIARAYSADLNVRFRQGDVGNILGFATTGDPAVAPILTLQSTIGRSRLAGAGAVDNLMAAAEKEGDPEAMKSYISDYIIDEFLTATTRQGDFNVAAANVYVSNKQAVLERIPETKALLDQAIEAKNALIATQARSQPNKATAAVVLNANPGTEIAALRRSTNVVQASREVRALLETDDTGKALSGFRQAIVEDLLDSSLSSKNVVDEQGNRIVEGFSMREAMNDPNMKSIMNEFLTPHQIARLHRITNTAVKVERARQSARSIEPIMDDKEGIITTFARRFLAAGIVRNIGDRVGFSGTVQGPGAGVRLSDEMYQLGLDPARKLIIDAVTSQDDKLLRAILHPEGLSVKFVYTQSNAWIMATAAQYGINLTESQSNSDKTR